MKKTLLSLALGGIIAISAQANPILPGMTGVAPDVLDLSGLTYVTGTSGALNSITFTGTYNAAVYSGTVSNSLYTCATCLTFVYQVTDNGAGPFPNSTGVIEDITASYFGNVNVDAGYASSTSSAGANLSSHGFVVGTMTPYTLDRSSAGNGDVVTFEYTGINGANELLPGITTRILVISTDATVYDPGLFSAIDGSTATVLAFGATLPQTGTPEPATFAMLGGSLIGLGLLRKRIAR